MNIHDIELPPLPEWSKMDNLGGLVPSEIRQALAVYARAAIEADRKRRGEPVAYLMGDEIHFEGEADMSDFIRQDGRPMYFSPQPTEPCVAPTSDKPASGAQNAIHATQPQQIPKGYRLVPVEPTLSMIAAARLHHEGEAYLPVGLYKAMLEAAPEVKP